VGYLLRHHPIRHHAVRGHSLWELQAIGRGRTSRVLHPGVDEGTIGSIVEQFAKNILKHLKYRNQRVEYYFVAVLMAIDGEGLPEWRLRKRVCCS
jgi:hypothetical protein